MRKLLIIAFLTISFMIPGAPSMAAREPAKPELTVKQALERAIANNKTLKSAGYDVDRSEKLREAAADKVKFTPTGPTTIEAETAFYDLVKADLNWQKAKKTYQAREDTVVRDVYQAYYEVLQAQEKVKVAESSLKTAELRKKAAVVGYYVGKTSKLALTQEEAAYEEAEATLEANRNSLDDAYQKFNLLTGLWPEDRPVLTDRPSFSPLKIDNLDTEVARAVEENLSVWQAKQDVDFSELELSLYNYATSNTPYEVKEIDLDKAEIAASQTEEEISREVRSTYYSLRQLEEQYVNLQKNVRMAQENLQVARIKQTLGLVAPVEVASSETSLAQANLSLLELVCQHVILKMSFLNPAVSTSPASK